MIENSDAVRPCPCPSVVPFSFRRPPSFPPSFLPSFGFVHRDRPVFFHSNCAPIVRSVPVGQSVCLSASPSLSVVFPSPPLAPQRHRRRGSISIDLKFSKPISCTRLPLTFEPEEEGELRRETSRYSKGVLTPYANGGVICSVLFIFTSCS